MPMMSQRFLRQNVMLEKIELTNSIHGVFPMFIETQFKDMVME